MLSFITLYQKDWQQHSYIAMNGVYESAVLKALENRPDLNEIYLCTDNDEGGIEAAERLGDILAEKGYTNIFRLAPLQRIGTSSSNSVMARNISPLFLMSAGNCTYGALSN